jgi:hypothetical protein
VLECNVAESLASGSAWCAFGPSAFTEHPCINVKARAERLSALAAWMPRNLPLSQLIRMPDQSTATLASERSMPP